MAKDKNGSAEGTKLDQKLENSGGQEEQINVGSLPVTVHAQYIKDLSFENPNAPESLRAGQAAPEMDINIGMDARKIESEKLPNLYEVILNIKAEAMRDKDSVFIVELLYGSTVQLEGVPEEQHHPMLLIEIPRIAFPFARQIIADTTIQSGFPPLLLNPVDFHALYLQRFGKDIEEASKDKQAS